MSYFLPNERKVLVKTVKALFYRQNSFANVFWKATVDCLDITRTNAQGKRSLNVSLQWNGKTALKTIRASFAKVLQNRDFHHCEGRMLNVTLIAAWLLILFPIDDRWMGESWCSCVYRQQSKTDYSHPSVKKFLTCSVARESTNLLDGELNSGTYAAAMILHL